MSILASAKRHGIEPFERLFVAEDPIGRVFLDVIQRRLARRG